MRERICGKIIHLFDIKTLLKSSSFTKIKKIIRKLSQKMAKI
jgi:hypothetical protein